MRAIVSSGIPAYSIILHGTLKNPKNPSNLPSDEVEEAHAPNDQSKM
jgi:hypothetical protein